MIHEYALEPEMVATWGTQQNYRYFISAFGLGQGRVASRFPKNWAKKVYDSFNGQDDNDKYRLVELLARLKEGMVKRRDYIWDESGKSWLENSLLEHNRYPFQAILSKNNAEEWSQVICEEHIGTAAYPLWDSPHGITVRRQAQDMATAVKPMLVCCRWVKLIDPYFSKATLAYKKSFSAFLGILAKERPTGPMEAIEIHTSGDGASSDYLKEYYKKVIPPNLKMILYQWKERPGGEKLHNRYILTDLGGVAFHHGLGTGDDGETDDLTRLDCEQYRQHCKEYDQNSTAFDLATEIVMITHDASNTDS